MGIRLPTRERWIATYKDNAELLAILGFVENPGTISQRSMEAAKLNANYQQGLWHSHLKVEDSILFHHEPIAGSESYVRLQLVPAAFCNAVFIAFHSNPLGRHFNAVRTLHFTHLWFYWPNMYTYINRMCQSCPGCTLTNTTCGKSRKLIYHFPIKAPVMVLHIDGYQAGKESGFEGSSHYLIACCEMCTFAVMVPIANANSTTYTAAIMKIILQFGLCHTCPGQGHQVLWCLL